MLPIAPRKLLLLGSDLNEESRLRKNLDNQENGRYEIRRFDSLDYLKAFALETICHAILIDIRGGGEGAVEAIRLVGELESPVPLVCLCNSHKQLRDFEDIIDFVDDYILEESLSNGELPIRISHAIRRRSREHELLHEQNLLQSLLEKIPDAIYFKDRESRFTKVNEAMAKSYGHTTDSILGKSDFDLFAEEHARPAYDDEQKIIYTGEPIIGKVEKETFDGRERVKWVNTTKLPLTDKNGQIIGTMGISRDVTELKATEERLAAERSQLRTIINYAGAGIFVKDLQGRYILVNKQHSDYLGLESPQAAEGTTIHDYLEPEMARSIDEADKKIMSTGDGIEGMVDHRVREGQSELYLLINKLPLLDDQGVCRGLVGISIDITKQKQNEQALKNAIETLESTKLQLIEAEKLKTVGRLAAGVAHEVKNPLNIVSLGAEYLESQISEPSPFLEIIQNMKTAVEKANSVILELLDYSSPHDLSMQAVDLNTIIRKVTRLLRHNFNEARVNVDQELDSSLPCIQGDAAKMEQVFINLFLNAINAMESGGSLSVCSYGHRMKSTGANVSSELTELFRIGDEIVTVEIKDTGSGISDKDAEKLFDPFYSTKETGEGTGLGLSVTRSIVEMHRGIISLSNRSDVRGACARLHFQTTPKTNA